MRRRTLTVAYHGKPASGLVFSPDHEQIYTLFSTSQWMIALDDPDARATLRLRLTMPRGWAGVASGREVSRREMAADTTLMEWRQDRPVPTYTFGFAIGAFTDVTERASGVTMRYLGRGFSAADLRGVFAESGRMLAFFEQRAGVPYPGETYAQALVARTAGQEMAGLSRLLGGVWPCGHCRPFADRIDRTRARAPVVGQPDHVPRVDGILAQRRIRDLHGGGLPRAALRSRDIPRRTSPT